MDLRLKPCSSTTTTLQNDLNCGDYLLLDRLTNLPDELIRILSLLPTKDAAVTSILSKRMSCIFPFITSLDFDDSPISHCSDPPFAIQHFPTFVTFVDSVLSAYQSQYLTSCKLGLGVRLHGHMLFGLRKELDLRIQVKEPGDCLLPLEIFTCETLEVLKLDVNLSLDRTSTSNSLFLMGYVSRAERSTPN
uniref:F-box domain-containing protein n=1 Tax=Chenopodium quinoa TaxID=63459 RepID=A0A803MLW9_CHEQI